MGISAEVCENGAGSGKGALTIDDPAFVEQFADEGGKGRRLGQSSDGAVELEAVMVEQAPESIAELGAKDLGQSANGEEESFLAGNPLAASQGAAGHDAVEMVVVEEILPPGMEDGGHANLATQVTVGELSKGLGGGGEEKLVERQSVLAYQRVELVRQGEDDVEVRNGQQPSLLLLEPLDGGSALTGRAMTVAAGMRLEVFLPAFAATIEMAAQGPGATGHQGPDDLRIGRTQ